MEIIINLTEPKNWPVNAPAYHSREGWELEKKVAYDKLKQELVTLKK
jgi:hypothetical protein